MCFCSFQCNLHAFPSFLLSALLLKMSVIVFSILLLATRVIWEPPPVGPQTAQCSISSILPSLQRSKFKKKIIICSLSVLCFPQIILTRSSQISGQNKSKARKPEGVVKITYGIVASFLFKRAGNSNMEKFLNCAYISGRYLRDALN